MYKRQVVRPAAEVADGPAEGGDVAEQGVEEGAQDGRVDGEGLGQTALFEELVGDDVVDGVDGVGSVGGGDQPAQRLQVVDNALAGVMGAGLPLQEAVDGVLDGGAPLDAGEGGERAGPDQHRVGFPAGGAAGGGDVPAGAAVEPVDQFRGGRYGGPVAVLLVEGSLEGDGQQQREDGPGAADPGHVVGAPEAEGVRGDLLEDAGGDGPQMGLGLFELDLLEQGARAAFADFGQGAGADGGEAGDPGAPGPLGVQQVGEVAQVEAGPVADVLVEVVQDQQQPLVLTVLQLLLDLLEQHPRGERARVVDVQHLPAASLGEGGDLQTGTGLPSAGQAGQEQSAAGCAEAAAPGVVETDEEVLGAGRVGGVLGGDVGQGVVGEVGAAVAEAAQDLVGGQQPGGAGTGAVAGVVQGLGVPGAGVDRGDLGYVGVCGHAAADLRDQRPGVGRPGLFGGVELGEQGAGEGAAAFVAVGDIAVLGGVQQ